MSSKRRFRGLEPCGARSRREIVNYQALPPCARMRFRFEMAGDVYSKHKESFKRLLAKHGLRWRASLDRPFCASGTERVPAVSDRDEDDAGVAFSTPGLSVDSIGNAP